VSMRTAPHGSRVEVACAVVNVRAEVASAAGFQLRTRSIVRVAITSPMRVALRASTAR